MLIATSIISALYIKTSGTLGDMRTVLPVVGSVVAEAVAALFVSQWRSAQKTMVSFLDGLSCDRRLDEALAMSRQIADSKIRSATESTLVLALLDLQPGRVEYLVDGLRALAGVSVADSDHRKRPEPDAARTTPVSR